MSHSEARPTLYDGKEGLVTHEARRILREARPILPFQFVCPKAWLLLAALSAVFLLENAAAAQQSKIVRARTRARPTAPRAAAPRRAALPRLAPLPPSVDPFLSVEQQAEQGRTFDVAFVRTPLDKKAEATAQVALNRGTLLVRLNAKDLPTPDRFQVPRYALWVYVPNYGVKLYIGDLPVIATSSATETITDALPARGTRQPTKTVRRRVARGTSESAYRFTALPADAEFGGLMLTAEPIRYTPIVNEALRPVLVGLTNPEDPRVNTAPAIYAGSFDYLQPNKPVTNNVKTATAPRRATPKASPKASRKPLRRTPPRTTRSTRRRTPRPTQ